MRPTIHFSFYHIYESLNKVILRVRICECSGKINVEDRERVKEITDLFFANSTLLL